MCKLSCIINWNLHEIQMRNNERKKEKRKRRLNAKIEGQKMLNAMLIKF